MRTPGMSRMVSFFRFATWAKPWSVTLLPSSCRNSRSVKPPMIAISSSVTAACGNQRLRIPVLPARPATNPRGIAIPRSAQRFQAREGAELGHPGGRQVGGGVPHEIDLLDAVELPDILQEFVVHVVAFNRDDDHRVEHVGAEGVAQPFRPSRLGVSCVANLRRPDELASRSRRCLACSGGAS